MAERVGVQNTPGACAFMKFTPLLANRSMLGVTACSYPIAPTQSFMSSSAKNSTFGGPSVQPVLPPAA
jgi:hypothetical protein